MRFLYISISVIGLILTLLPSFFVFNGVLKIDTAKILMLIGSLLWLAVTPFWINDKKLSSSQREGE
jgi:hypothetical protein